MFACLDLLRQHSKLSALNSSDPRDSRSYKGSWNISLAFPYQGQYFEQLIAGPDATRTRNKRTTVGHLPTTTTFLRSCPMRKCSKGRFAHHHEFSHEKIMVLEPQLHGVAHSEQSR
eukprot:SAG31_NODE_3283_length_4466_cov_1.746279_5_plen_116_part_00